MLDQNPSLLSRPSLGNTGMTICLNLKHGDDLEAAGKALTLPRDQWDSIGKLPTGQAIVKVQDRWQKPFLVRFPLFQVSKYPEPRRRSRETVRTDSLQRTVEESDSALKERIRPLPSSERRENKISGITMEERNFLSDIAEYPLSTITERYARLGLSVHKANSIKQKLLEKGLIGQEKIRVPEGNVTLLKLTHDGRDLLASWGIKVNSLPKNASLEHEYYKELVAREYRSKGYDVEKEVPIGEGKAVDLVATKGDDRIAIEVETGKSDIKGNVRKCKEVGFDEVVTIHTKTSMHKH